MTDKNYLLVRISHLEQFQYPLLHDEGYLTIGWGKLTKEESKSLLRAALTDDNGKKFDQTFQDIYEDKVRNRWSLWRFLRAKKSDIIVVPLDGKVFSEYNKKFAVCEVVENAAPIHELELSPALKEKKYSLNEDGLYVNNELVDLGFIIKIKVIKICERSVSSALLISRMKVRQTVVEIWDLESDIKSVLENNNSIAENLYNKFYSNKLNDVGVENLINAFLSNLSPDQLERLLKEYMRELCADSTILPKHYKDKTGDCDVLATFERLHLRVCIQVKRHNIDSHSDSTAISQIRDYVKDCLNKDPDFDYVAWAVTSAESFNEEAQNLATEDEHIKVRLLDKDDLKHMIIDVGADYLKRVI